MKKLVGLTKKQLELLQTLQEKAVEQKRDSFWFGDQEYLTSYAKYLIEYYKCRSLHDEIHDNN